MVSSQPSASNRATGQALKIRLTVASAEHYSFHMADTNRQAGAEIELKRLEKRIDELIVTVHQLKEENRALRQRQESLSGERTVLLGRNDQVRTRLEAMIGRLRAMEHSA